MSDLSADLLAVIRRGAHAPLTDPEFDALARRVFAYQFEHNPPYRAFCERRGVEPGGVRHWTEMPAVPTDAFKAAPLLCGPPERAVAVFRTSGTTAGRQRRGEHHFVDLALYDAALLEGFRRHLLPDDARLPVLALVPSPADAPDSSLSHMVGQVVGELGAGESEYYVGPDGLRLEALLDRLRAAVRAGTPVLLPGTSFSFVHLLDALEATGEALELPAGSRAMDTGGFKGRSREVSRAALYAALRERLGLAPEWCVNEYGMTEMSSQFYDAVAGRPADAQLDARAHHGPSWVRTVAADPETLHPLAPGETGVLRHLDLANLHSVAALQTADLGRVGEHGIELLGRARGAEARGCSIAMDELLQAMG